jgi:hypothetical protein
MTSVANDNRFGPNIEKALEAADTMDAAAAGLARELDLARTHLGAEAVAPLEARYETTLAAARSFREAIEATKVEWLEMQRLAGKAV